MKPYPWFDCVTEILSNDTNTALTISYREEGILREYHLTAVDGEEQYELLLKNIQDNNREDALEKIQLYTKAKKDQMDAEFHQAALNYANYYGWDTNSSGGGLTKYSRAFETLLEFSNDTDEDVKELFELKIKVFETDLIANSDDTDLRTKIRKATTPIEVMIYFCGLLGENNEI